MIDQHTDKNFLEAAFKANEHLKVDYSLGTIKNYKDIPGWINDAEWIYDRIVNEAEDGDILLELGTFFGQSAARMAELIKSSNKNLKFYTMDIYHEMEVALATDRHPKSFKDFRNAHNYTDLYNLVKNIFTFLGFENYIEQIICDSRYGHKLFDDNSLKMVYVDANHTFEYVYADLKNYWPKIKSGGYLICDDIVYDSVTEAVDRFCEEELIPLEKREYNKNSVIIKK